ncbi:MAG: hypothetical protein WDM90_01470 [Ferruginibacter sp.]
MKKLFAGIALLFIYANSNAQLVYVQGGLNLANISTTSSGHTEDNNMLPTLTQALQAGSVYQKQLIWKVVYCLPGKVLKQKVILTAAPIM